MWNKVVRCKWNKRKVDKVQILHKFSFITISVAQLQSSSSPYSQTETTVGMNKLTFTRLQGATTLKTAIFRLATTRTSNPTLQMATAQEICSCFFITWNNFPQVIFLILLLAPLRVNLMMVMVFQVGGKQCLCFILSVSVLNNGVFLNFALFSFTVTVYVCEVYKYFKWLIFIGNLTNVKRITAMGFNVLSSSSATLQHAQSSTSSIAIEQEDGRGMKRSGSRTPGSYKTSVMLTKLNRGILLLEEKENTQTNFVCKC